MKNLKLKYRTIIASTVCAVMFLLQSEVSNGSSDIHTNKALIKSAIYKDQPAASLNKSDVIKADTSSLSEVNIDDNKANKVVKKSYKGNCRKEGCNLFAEIDKSEQVMYVYVSGELQNTFPVSTGKTGHETPNLDLRPSGPMYRSYTSTKYPEGDYQGMGNMPYAVFLRGGYAIHGTTKGSIPKLGSKASHGCVRLHPEDASVFFDMVKSIGLENTWVTIHP